MHLLVSHLIGTRRESTCDRQRRSPVVVFTGPVGAQEGVVFLIVSPPSPGLWSSLVSPSLTMFFKYLFFNYMTVHGFGDLLKGVKMKEAERSNYK